MENQIELVQVPVIKHAVSEIGKAVKERIDALNIPNLVATEETVKALKKLSAELNKEFTEFEEQRKAVKNAILAPYSEFEEEYKIHFTENYKSAISMLKEKIEVVETEILEAIKSEIKSYFEESTNTDKLSWLKFEQLGLKILKSTSIKKYKEEIDGLLSKISDDLDLIATEEHQAEMMAEYKITLNASKAISGVRERKQREKEEKDRIIFQRTQRRESQLRSFAFVYREFIKTWEQVQNSDLFYSQSVLETLSDEEWNKLVFEVQEALKPKNIEAPKVERLAQTPPVEQKAPEILTAEFRVQGTREQLIALGEYLKTNNISYTNI